MNVKSTWMKAVGIILCLCMLSGCASLSFVPGPMEEAGTLPEPSEQVPSGLSGDGRADYNYRATLYYISTDQQQLVPVVSTIKISDGDVLAEKVMQRLLEPSGTREAVEIAPVGTKLLSLEQSQGIITVNLSIDARSLSDHENVWMHAAIANTLTELPGIRYANVLVGGQDESALGLPTGTLERTDGNLTALYAGHQVDEERFLKAASNEALIDRDVTLYFASTSGKYLVPEVRPIRFSNQNYVATLLNELIKGPAQADAVRGILPEGETVESLLEQTPDIMTTDDGFRVIRFYFDKSLLESLNREGMSAWQLYGSLTLTMCRSVPEVDGIMVYIGGGRVVRVSNGEEEVMFDASYVMPDNFEGSIGQSVRLYFGGEDGNLHLVNRVMDISNATLPRTLIEELIGGPYVYEQGATWVVPEGITEADILGIRIEGDMMMINLSSNFYRCCQNLTQLQERNLIYAIVNTMTELTGIKRVRFFVEAQFVDTLVKFIYLRSPLIRNPGLIR